MKKSKNILSLVLLSTLAIGLASCNDQKDSIVSSSEVTQTSSSTDTNASLTAALNKLAKGYKATSLITQVVTYAGSSSGTDSEVGEYYVLNTIASDAYRADSSDFYNKDEAVPEYVETTYVQSVNGYAAAVGLDLSNNIVSQNITGSNGLAIKWDNSGFINAFTKLTAADFELGDNGVYNLKVKTTAQKLALNRLGAQLSGGVSSLSTSTFSLELDSNYVYYDLVFKTGTLSSYNATLGLSIHGEINLDETGEGLTAPLAPITGEEDADLKAALDSLKQNKWETSIKLNEDYVYPSGLSSYGVENINLSYSISGKTDGKDFLAKQTVVENNQYTSTSISGFKSLDDGSLVSLHSADINNPDDLYYDGAPVKNTTLASSKVLPSFDISSVLFKKDASSTDTVLKYTLKDSINVYDLSGDYFSVLNDTIEDFSKFSIEINKTNNTITFTDASTSSVSDPFYGLGDYGITCELTSTSSVVYSQVGTLNETIIDQSKVHENCDNLSLSNFVSDYYATTSSYAKYLNAIIPLEDLDSNVPALGGVYSSIAGLSMINFGTSSAPSYPVFYIAYAGSSTSEVKSMLDTYVAKLTGYTKVNVDLTSNTLDNVWKFINGDFTNYASYKKAYGEKTIYLDLATEGNNLYIAIRTSVPAVPSGN